MTNTNNGTKIAVLFVCTGNICRSPTAHAVFETLVKAMHLEDKIKVDSAGIIDYHVGEAPDKRARLAAKKKGYDMGQLRARQIQLNDYEAFAYLLAMDQHHLSEMQRQSPARFRNKIHLFLAFANTLNKEVKDPYYGDSKGFEPILAQIEDGSKELLAFVSKKHNL